MRVLKVCLPLKSIPAKNQYQTDTIELNTIHLQHLFPFLNKKSTDTYKINDFIAHTFPAMHTFLIHSSYNLQEHICYEIQIIEN